MQTRKLEVRAECSGGLKTRKRVVKGGELLQTNLGLPAAIASEQHWGATKKQCTEESACLSSPHHSLA